MACMGIPSVFLSEPVIVNDTVSIHGADAHYLAQVRRIRVNEHLYLVCTDTAYRAAVSGVERNKVTVRVLEESVSNRGGHVRFIIGQAILKGTAMDAAVDQLIQVGADEIIPLICERTIVRIKDTAAKTARLQRIALSAASQSERRTYPKIFPAMKFQTFINEFIGNYTNSRILCCDGRSGKSLKNLLPNYDLIGNIILIIGPEGGLTDNECAMVSDAGGLILSLGNTILRGSLAGAVAVSCIKQLSVNGEHNDSA